MKTCRTCGKEFPATDEYFGWQNKALRLIRGQCKKCTAKHVKQYHEENKEAIAEYKRKYNSDNKEVVVEQRKQRNLDNKEAIAEYGKQYRAGHKEAIAERMKKYNSDNKEARNEYTKKYSLDNKEARNQYREDNKEHAAEYAKRYLQEHVEEYRIRTHKRNARIRNLPHTLTVPQWLSIKETFNNKCAYCGKELPLEQDHFIPVTKDGWYVKNNIVPACRRCNTSKNNQDAIDWFSKQPFYTKRKQAKIIKYLGYTKAVMQLSFA